MSSVFGLIGTVFEIYIIIVVLRVLFDWLISFEVLPAHNPMVSRFTDLFYQLTEPVLEKIRRFVPLIAGFDLSPLVLILALGFLRNFILGDVQNWVINSPGVTG